MEKDNVPTKIGVFEEDHLFNLISRVYHWWLQPPNTRGNLHFEWNESTFVLPYNYDYEKITVDCLFNWFDEPVKYIITKSGNSISGQVTTTTREIPQAFIVLQEIPSEAVDLFMQLIDTSNG
jgi:hypothetical protein